MKGAIQTLHPFRLVKTARSVSQEVAAIDGDRFSFRIPFDRAHDKISIRRDTEVEKGCNRPSGPFCLDTTKYKFLPVTISTSPTVDKLTPPFPLRSCEKIGTSGSARKDGRLVNLN